jgi:Tfp pilus assembly protein PilN
MIKINLTATKKSLDISNIGGFDFTKLKIVPILLALGVVYAPDFILVPMWEEEVAALDQKLTAEQGRLNKLKREVSQSQNFEKQIRELKTQEDNLGKKLIAVKQAISEKKNPSTLLLYIAKNIPNELWITSLTIENESMTIKGDALDYTSIGNFVSSLKSSVFIKDANIMGTTSNVRASDKRRIESFEVKFLISRFEQ